MLILEIGIVLLLILLNGLLAMSELAIVSSRTARLQAEAERGNRGARVALELVEDPSRFLSTVQIGITLVGILAGAFGGATIADTFGDVLDRVPWIAPNGDTVAITIVVILITYVSLIVGELVPKRIAHANPERVAMLVAGPMRALSRLAGPAVWLLRHSSDAVLRLLGLTGIREATVTEEEVKLLIAEATESGVFAEEERRMIDGVLRLADRSVRAIMTPRSEVVWVDVAADRETIVRTIEANRYTRLLVCDGSIDNAIGYVDMRDLLVFVLHGGDIDLSAAMKQVLVVAEQTAVLKLIDLFRHDGIHFALIVDEYGATQGVVTSTDVLESIAGDLPERGEVVEQMIVPRGDGSWLVDGMLPIDEFEELVGVRGLRTDGGFETLAGFVIDQLGRLPKAGDRVMRDDMTLEVVDMDGRRIDKVLVTPVRVLAGD